MKKIESILVPTDFSQGSEAAIDAARSLATKLGAELEILHVWDGEEERLMPPLIVDFEDGTASRLLTEVRAHGLSLERASAELERLAGEGLRFRARFLTGAAAEKIVQVAIDEGHDLVVMGTHGRTGVRRMVLGSVAENVVRTCPVPVLTVHSNEKARALAERRVS